MCYSRCPYEHSYTGECRANRDQLRDPRAHCNEADEDDSYADGDTGRYRPELDEYDDDTWIYDDSQC